MCNIFRKTNAKSKPVNRLSTPQRQQLDTVINRICYRISICLFGTTRPLLTHIAARSPLTYLGIRSQLRVVVFVIAHWSFAGSVRIWLVTHSYTRTRRVSKDLHFAKPVWSTRGCCATHTLFRSSVKCRSTVSKCLAGLCNRTAAPRSPGFANHCTWNWPQHSPNGTARRSRLASRQAGCGHFGTFGAGKQSLLCVEIRRVPTLVTQQTSKAY